MGTKLNVLAFAVDATIFTKRLDVDSVATRTKTFLKKKTAQLGLKYIWKLSIMHFATHPNQNLDPLHIDNHQFE